MPIHSAIVLLAYVYDAEGTRAAKGTVNALSCDFSSNGFAATTSYVVGASGDDLTEFDLQNGQWAWSHSDVNEGDQLLATYSGTDTSFSLHDWLGTKRVEVTPDSLLSTFSSFPFGDGLTTSGNAPDVSEKHFTGKERDAESGLDYFGARYYASPMGHWMSPDWSAKAEPVPYAKLASPQTLNLYSYVENNPITGMDPDGHYKAAWLGAGVNNVGGAMGGEGLLGAAARESVELFAQEKEQDKSEAQQTNQQSRDALAAAAKGSVGSTAWAYETPPCGNKCSKFVADTIHSIGADATFDLGDGKSRAPLAGEWANAKAKISNWRVLGANETPEPGDVAAVHIMNVHQGATGHVGIVARDPSGRLSAVAQGDHGLGYDHNFIHGYADVTYRRYTGGTQ